jgi:hypothetical protein
MDATDARLAESLTEELMQNIEYRTDQTFRSDSQIYLADVEAAIERFNMQVKVSQRYGSPLLCVVYDDDLIPLDWAGSFGIFWAVVRDSSANVQEMYLQRLRTIVESSFYRLCLEQANIRTIQAKSDEVMLFMRRGLVSFLSARIAAKRIFVNRLGNLFSGAAGRKQGLATNRGLRFRVITKQHGLRVHYSPSYFFNPSHVFGSPTSPVDGWIQPGRYKFGAVGPGFPLRFEPADFDIPPLRKAQLVTI